MCSSMLGFRGAGRGCVHGAGQATWEGLPPYPGVAMRAGALAWLANSWYLPTLGRMRGLTAGVKVRKGPQCVP